MIITDIMRTKTKGSRYENYPGNTSEEREQHLVGLAGDDRIRDIKIIGDLNISALKIKSVIGIVLQITGVSIGSFEINDDDYNFIKEQKENSHFTWAYFILNCVKNNEILNKIRGVPNV